MKKLVAVYALLVLTMLLGTACIADIASRHSSKDDHIAVCYADPSFENMQELIKALKNKTYADSTGVHSIESTAIEKGYFYAPAKEFPGFRLMEIVLSKDRLVFYYVPNDHDSKWFSRETGILVMYSLEEPADPNKHPMSVIADYYSLPKTDTGYLYIEDANTIYFELGAAWMSIMVPDSMNDYETLKSLCVAEKISLNTDIESEVE